MENISDLAWHNPHQKIWGFHIHQELPLEDFSKALVIQQNCNEFLKEQGITVDASDVMKPGYGPHLDYMWELRVESAKTNVLEKMGLAISYLAVNRFGLSGYIHPLMHDVTLPSTAALAAEGRDNQVNALWFGYRVPQNQDFFFNPPKDQQNQLIDTRTSRIIPQEERDRLLASGKLKLPNHSFKNPYQTVINGFHIHMDFSTERGELALTIFDNFLAYLLSENLQPTSTRIYAPGENGPHLLGGWEVKFETKEPTILAKIGVAIGWLMCNRQGLSVFMHPVTWEGGDFREELKAHEEYAFFLGEMPALDLRFFSAKITQDDTVAV